MRTKPTAGVLRLGTRSPNQFVVIPAEALRPRLTVLGFALAGMVAALLAPLGWPVQTLFIVVASVAVALLLRRPRAALWLERPLRGSGAPVAARIEMQEVKPAERAFVRISRVSGVDTFEVPVERRGTTAVVRFGITPAADEQLCVEAVVAERIYRFTV